MRGQAVIEALICAGVIIGFIVLAFSFLNQHLIELFHIENDFKAVVHSLISK